MDHSQATLCYLIKEGRVLLIHKKRGIGAGKINGPGGKVEAGETPLQAVVRETHEETGVTPLDPDLRGFLRFRFKGGHVSRCFVYRASEFAGQLRETDEALPEWFTVGALPYERMWSDDQHWLPWLLGGLCFEGEVDIDGEEAGQHRLRSIKHDGFISFMRYHI